MQFCISSCSLQLDGAISMFVKHLSYWGAETMQIIGPAWPIGMELVSATHADQFKPLQT